jgi:putative oxidoreductase
MDTGRHRDLGLFLLRVGIGASFVGHGLPKLLGGPSKWHALGTATAALGVHFAPTFFGLMAALSEFGGGLLLAAGVLFRPACSLMLATMVVAVAKHLEGGDGFATASHAMEAAVVFLSLLLIGPGSWRIRIGR